MKKKLETSYGFGFSGYATFNIRASLWSIGPIASNRASRYAHWPTQGYAGRKVFLSVGLVASENQSELRGILTFSFIIIRSGIVTVVIDFSMCGIVFSIAAR